MYTEQVLKQVFVNQWTIFGAQTGRKKMIMAIWINVNMKLQEKVGRNMWLEIY